MWYTGVCMTGIQKEKFISRKMFLTCSFCLYHYKGGLSKFVSVPHSHAYTSWRPCTGSGTLSSNGDATQEGCECFVTCWATVRDSCSVAFQNWTWTWTPTWKASVLFWDITQRQVVIFYWRFWTTYRSHTIHCLRTSVKDYHLMLGNIPEESADLNNVAVEAWNHEQHLILGQQTQDYRVSVMWSTSSKTIYLWRCRLHQRGLQAEPMWINLCC
jgi:hypothetical protein